VAHCFERRIQGERQSRPRKDVLVWGNRIAAVAVVAVYAVLWLQADEQASVRLWGQWWWIAFLGLAFLCLGNVLARFSVFYAPSVVLRRAWPSPRPIVTIVAWLLLLTPAAMMVLAP